MRRSDREITDKQAIEALIAREQILRVAFYDNGDLYIVPVNYGYTRKNDQYTFYFHGAKAGRKYALSKANPRVGFEIDGGYQLMENMEACRFSASFQSVIGTGTLRLVDDPAEKKQGLDALMRQTTRRSDWDFPDATLQSTAVFELAVDQISCKAK